MVQGFDIVAVEAWVMTFETFLMLDLLSSVPNFDCYQNLPTVFKGHETYLDG